MEEDHQILYAAIDSQRCAWISKQNSEAGLTGERAEGEKQRTDFLTVPLCLLHNVTTIEFCMCRQVCSYTLV